MKTDDCFQKGLLRTGSPDLQKALRSLEVAAVRLNELHKVALNDVLPAHLFLVGVYMAMFHTARALLFKDGVKERSHYCLCEYVREKYGPVLEARFLTEFEALREQRHETLYGLEVSSPTTKELEHLLVVAKDFLVAVRRIVKK